MDIPGPLWGIILLVVVLHLVNGYLKACRLAVISVSKSRMAELCDDGDIRACKLAKISEEPSRYLEAIDAMVTIVFLLCTGFIFRSLHLLMIHYQVNSYAIYPIFAVSGLILVILYILLSDFIPKRIAVARGENFSLKCVGLVNSVRFFMMPIVYITEKLAAGLLRVLGIDPENFQEKISEEEIRSFIKVGQEQGVINSAGEEMINSIFEFDDKLAYEIMTPRTDVYMIDYDEFSGELIKEMLNSGFSRIPVYKDTTDNITGIIYIKDLFVEFAKSNYRTVLIENVMKKPYYVPESKNIDFLLREMQATKNYVAILIDEYGGFSGMVTMEDIVEEIVGEIEDEYDKEDDEITKLGDHLYLVDGSADIDDINYELGIKLSSENHETMSGLFIELLGFIPEEPLSENYVVSVDNVELKALSLKDKRIGQMEIIIH